MDLHEEIEKVAYELYEKSGRTDGKALDNWFEAERIVRARQAEAAGTTGTAKKPGRPRKAAAKAPAPKKAAAARTPRAAAKTTARKPRAKTGS